MKHKKIIMKVRCSVCGKEYSSLEEYLNSHHVCKAVSAMMDMQDKIKEWQNKGKSAAQAPITRCTNGGVLRMYCNFTDCDAKSTCGFYKVVKN